MADKLLTIAFTLLITAILLTILAIGAAIYIELWIYYSCRP